MNHGNVKKKDSLLYPECLCLFNPRVTCKKTSQLKVNELHIGLF